MAEIAIQDPPVTPPVIPAVVPDWRTGLTGDFAPLAQEPSLASFKGKDWAEVGPALAKSYVETKKLVGVKTTLKIPDEHATPDEVAAYRKAVGVPDTPDGYRTQIRRPEAALAGWDEDAEMKFLVWFDEKEGEGSEIEALDPEDAAERYLDEAADPIDWEREGRVVVQDENSVVHQVMAYAEATWSWSARLVG